MSTVKLDEQGRIMLPADLIVLKTFICQKEYSRPSSFLQETCLCEDIVLVHHVLLPSIGQYAVSFCP
jgi:hypothetical protein